MRFFAVSTLLIMLSGCSFVDVYEFDNPGQYEISVVGNIFFSREGLLEKIQEKAESLCGHKDYYIADTNGVVYHNTKVYQSNGPTLNSPTKTLTMVVSCDQLEPLN